MEAHSCELLSHCNALNELLNVCSINGLANLPELIFQEPSIQ